MKKAIKISTDLVYSSILSALVMSSAVHAQLITIQDPAARPAQAATEEERQLEESLDGDAAVEENNNSAQYSSNATVSNSALRSDNAAIPVQPVTITPGMQPQVASPVSNTYSTEPVSVSSRRVSPGMAMVDPASGVNVAAPSTGIGGSNPGNANTGGVQVQNVTVQATQDQSADENSSDLLKRVRQMKEGETNQVALDKIEESRMENELNLRNQVNTAFSKKSSDDLGLDSVPQSVAVQAPVSVPVAPVGAQLFDDDSALANASSHQVVRARRDHTGFRLSPTAGYRWFQYNNNFSEYQAQNLGMGGVSLEGIFSRYASIEGTFLYGRDEFYYRGLNGYGANYYNDGFYNGGYYNNGYYGPYNNPLFAPRSRDSFEVSGALKLNAAIGPTRPYILGGIGGIIQKYNIDDSFTTQMLNQIGLQRTTTNIVGNIGAGIDFAANNSLSLGARFDYQAFLNREFTEMDRIFGDNANRYRVMGALQLNF